MNSLTILTIILVLIAIGMIALILLQRGAGATTGAAFGSGASGTVFGARGAGSFLTRTTGVMAALFFAIALAMAVMVARGIGITDNSQNSVMDSVVTGLPSDSETADENMFSADDLPVEDASGDVSGDVATGDDLPAAEQNNNGAELPAADPAAVSDTVNAGAGEQQDDGN
ncbi:MAG: preprotein translocase subunit SecG [Gammaproteobacteria bacterium]|jgi:preprotein translocase subunit SecG|nr:preprotein translocase subunit SecG [Gammaproteobacteria bacterium]